MNVQEVVWPYERRRAELRRLPDEQIAACKSYRDAVWLAWQNRTRTRMTKSILADLCGLYVQHVSNFVNPDPKDCRGNRRAELPVDAVQDFQRAVGNEAISQYFARLGAVALIEGTEGG